MKQFVVILGPHAVGKMTVGQELAKITGLTLFHNHMTIELVRNFFSVHESEEGARLNHLFRQEIFEAVAKSDLPGMIFTYMFAFDEISEYDYIHAIIALFQSHGAQTTVVELCADFDVRIERNKTTNRLQHKPSKRNLEHSESLFRRIETEHRLNSIEGDCLFPNYFKLNNTTISPEEAAETIKTYLQRSL